MNQIIVERDSGIGGWQITINGHLFVMSDIEFVKTFLNLITESMRLIILKQENGWSR